MVAFTQGKKVSRAFLSFNMRGDVSATKRNVSESVLRVPNLRPKCKTLSKHRFESAKVELEESMGFSSSSAADIDSLNRVF